MNRRKLYTALGIAAGSLLVIVGVFAANDWFPKTDPISGQKFGWFGKKLPKNYSASVWNPLPPPSPTPQLSKEYLYAGSRLLAVEDANAVAAPPADLAVWRPTGGVWMVMGQTGSATTTLGFGLSSDVPLIGDYDGDGKTDFSVYREGSTSTFYVWPSGPTSWYGFNWGITNDDPAVGDYDGDGKTDYAIVRPNTGAGVLDWWVRTSSNSSHFSVAWGTLAHKPAPADYDGDGKTDVAVFDPTGKIFYVYNSSDSSVSELSVGYDGTIVSSDYDGDGKADPAIYVPSTATWYVRQSTTNSVVSQVWGNNGTSGCTGSCTALFPVQNDYDLDGKTDLAVWDNGSSAVWTIRRSSNGTTRTETFGTTNDIPVPAFYRR
ncbi:MAG: FG-GAP repeat domain-containing protein [Pyrinomonadaceae bacterium]